MPVPLRRQGQRKPSVLHRRIPSAPRREHLVAKRNVPNPLVIAGARFSGTRRISRRARRNVPTVSRSVRWQERDTNQASPWRWDRAADDEVVAARPWASRQDGDADRGAKWRRDDSLPIARSGGRWQDREVDQASSWRRERYDEYPRGDDRRVLDRAAREDDRVMGRARRDEGQLQAFPPVKYRW